MFHIIILYISLNIWNGFFGYLFGFFNFFGLPVRVRLITLRILICFVPPYKTHSDIFYISNRIQIGFFRFGFWISGYGYYVHANLNLINCTAYRCLTTLLPYLELNEAFLCGWWCEESEFFSSLCAC